MVCQERILSWSCSSLSHGIKSSIYWKLEKYNSGKKWIIYVTQTIKVPNVVSFKRKCGCFPHCNSSMHACLKLKNLLWMWSVLFPPSEHSFSFCYLIVGVKFYLHSVLTETRKWLYKKDSYLNFISHSAKLLIGKYSYLTPALNTIRDRRLLYNERVWWRREV